MNQVVEIFSPAAHQDVLAFVTGIAILLLMARVFGEIALRLGQPAVVGEILAGIFLGPSCLGNILPFLKGIVIPGTAVQGYLLDAIGLIGAIFLLLITGLETDLKLIRRHARTALSVSWGGILFTFSSGFILGELLPDTLLADNGQRMVFSLFIATAMSISAIPVIAKVLMEMKLMRRDIGQIILAAGMSDDTTGWIFLSIVAGLASGKVFSLESVVGAVLKVAIFLIVSFTLGKFLVRKMFDLVQERATSRDRVLTMTVVVTFLGAAASQALHLEPVLGAFVAGILIGQMPRFPQSAFRRLESIALGVFVPIFFAIAGLKVNVLNLLRPDLMLITLIVILIATLGKVLGTYSGARLIGRQGHWSALSFGAALNARGAMEIIVATVGLSLGILTQEMFSIIVLMAMVTSLMAPTALRFTLKHVQPTTEELGRLRGEELFRNSLMDKIHRVLVPVRARQGDMHFNTIQAIKARIIQRIGQKRDLAVTLMCVEKEANKEEHNRFLDTIAGLFSNKKVSKKIVASAQVTNQILEEAKKDYDLLVLGATEEKDNSEYLFTKVIDSLVRFSPCATMVVHSRNISENWSPKKILVPTNGSLPSKHAAELAFFLTGDEEEVVLLNVIETRDSSLYYDINDQIFQSQMKFAQGIIKELKELGELRKARVSTSIKIGPEAESVILEVANNDGADLIILGSDIRPATGRLYLGAHVERILRNAPCPVIIINAG